MFRYANTDRIDDRLGSNSPILGLCQLLPPAPDIGLPMLPPPCAKSRPEQVQQWHMQKPAYSITSSAVASSVGGTVRPSMRAIC
jgi:hypothetical protein